MYQEIVILKEDDQVFRAPRNACDLLSAHPLFELPHGGFGKRARPKHLGGEDRPADQFGFERARNRFNFGEFGHFSYQCIRFQ